MKCSRLLIGTVATAALALGVHSSAFAADTVSGEILVGHTGDATPTVEHVGNVSAGIATATSQDGVTYAEPVYRTTAVATQSNAGFGDEWQLTAASIARAWNLTGAGSASVLVGSVDSGVNFSHAALAGASLWTNTAEIAGNGIDDDHDGCVDDVHGCDFVDDDGDPSDANGHGTATAGEIVAQWGATSKYAGVAPASTLITARALDANGMGNTAQLAAALDYVASHGARVVNVSVTGPDSQAVDAVIAAHPGTLFVAAAGNSNTDDDAASSAYPCADPAPNVLCVGAIDQTGTLASFSNYGATSVDLAAPGARIATLTLNGYSNGWSGTSMAAPLVTGTAALAFAADPTATVAAVKAAILSTTDANASLAGRTVTGGTLDAYAALHALTGRSDATPTATPTNTSTVTTTPVANASTASTPATGTLRITSKAKRSGSSALKITLRCTGAAGCSGTIGDTKAKRSTTFALHAGSAATISVPAKLKKGTKTVELLAKVAGVTFCTDVSVTR